MVLLGFGAYINAIVNRLQACWRRAAQETNAYGHTKKLSRASRISAWKRHRQSRCLFYAWSAS